MVPKENVLRVREEIEFVCRKVKRSPGEITLIAVVKEANLAQIKEAINAGIFDLGENKVREALIKYNQLNTQHPRLTPARTTFSRARSFGQAIRNTLKWHMIGHLQTNKVKEAVRIFDLIHSVDSQHLAEEINKQAKKINKIQDILIEVNTSGEKTKFGLKPDETIEVIKKASEFKNIRINGLMTIAPLSNNPEEARPYFKMLRELKEKIVVKLGIGNWELGILSMGMSQDYKVAIEEGATIVRIGRAIFGS
ncbi:MAG: YggS family pyridoxal phosphate-dependent enzyme [Candidatus Omnitrophota bacterium]|nr:YggS family pyridoxal phosphate-dependent enzyme [Candidatus Omnitrophota bacterium]